MVGMGFLQLFWKIIRTTQKLGLHAITVLYSLNGFHIRYMCRSRELLKQYHTVWPSMAIIHVAVLPNFQVFL